MKIIKDVKKERKITLEFTEDELIVLFIGYGCTNAQKREKDYPLIFDNTMPNHIAKVNENNNLYNDLYEIIVNPTDVIKDNDYQYSYDPKCGSNQL